MDSKTAIGIILIFGGIFIAVGSISGNLGGMLAAQFDPSDLATGTASQKAGSSPSLLHDLGGYIGNLSHIPGL